MKRNLRTLIAAVVLALGSTGIHAGPVIIDGTDANDHGGVSGGVNTAGWLYMQRALENLAAQVTPAAARVLVNIGTTGSTAQAAINSAFALSSLASSGWVLQNVDGAAAIATYFSTLSTATTGILYLPTVGLTAGDMTTAELAVVNANAAIIDSFVGGAGNPASGGALFSMGEAGAGAYGWLSTLIPGIVATDVGGGGIGTNISLTAAGAAAFPGLTNADLAGADPWHGFFSGNLGGLSVLGTALQGNNTRAVIIGGGRGTVIGCGQPGQPPCPTPEPETLPLLGIAGLALALSGWRQRRRNVK